MDSNDFWRLVDKAAATPGGVSEHAVELERLLREKSPSEIEEFARIQAELMRVSYLWELWGAAYVINQGCSDDGFDYFRGWLLMQGRDVWEAAMRDPETLADITIDEDAECEEVLYVASRAYEEATGAALANQAPGQSEPTGVHWRERDLKTKYPRLWERFGSSGEGGLGDKWDRQMMRGMSLLASGDYAHARETFARLQKEAERPLTRTIATNNLAWTNLLIGTPEANAAALRLARQARQEVTSEPGLDWTKDGVHGTLAFALIKNGEASEGLALIDEILGRTPPSSLYATRLCIQAIGLAKLGEVEKARSTMTRARELDPNCQLLGQARVEVFGAQAIPVPVTLRALVPLVDEFAIADDSKRESALEAAPTEKLLMLVRTVTVAVFAEINRYLDETDNAEDAVPFGDLAQAAMEARLELRRRGVPES